MPLAEWSGKGAVEHQQYVLLPSQFSQAEIPAREIWEGEIGGGLVERDTGHEGSFSNK